MASGNGDLHIDWELQLTIFAVLSVETFGTFTGIRVHSVQTGSTILTWSQGTLVNI